MKKEQKVKLAKILSELDYEFVEEKDETAKVGSYTVVFVRYSKIEECCGRCFLNTYRQGKKCLPCRSFERKDGKDGFWRFSSQMEYDETERRIVSARYRAKNKEKGVYDDEKQ